MLDCGVGLPDDIEILFQPFHSTKENGLGLGLSICRTLVTAHGGKLWAERRAERGAAFSCRPASGRERRLIPVRFAVACLMVLTHAGPTLAAVARINHVLDPGKAVGGAAVAPNGTHALTWSASEIRFWDLDSGSAIAEDESEEIPDCRRDSGRGWASPDGVFVALACNGVVLIDMRAPKVVARLGEGLNTSMVSFSADSRRLVRLVNASGAQALETYDIAEYVEPSWFWETYRSLFGYDENEPDAAFSLSRSPDEAVSSVIFSTQPDQLLLLTPTTFEARSIQGNHDSRTDVVTWACPGGNFSEVTPAKYESLEAILSGLRGEVTGCVLNTDHSDIWIANQDLKTRWDTDSGKQLWFHSRQGGIAYLEATPDQRFLAAASKSGEVNIFDWKGRSVAHTEFPKDKVKGPPANECAPADRLVMSVDGQTVLFIDCRVYVWKVE